ncbi:hypothetical protein [Nitrosomonas supralitoralis]|uniref:hypothetical protein n=1 Tax=Nitrosomonas supralitoralis TaxID=2116706 RepID=UPI00155989AF|nr:hypothetical protein [Nitrosomonas supralitoralis]
MHKRAYPPIFALYHLPLKRFSTACLRLLSRNGSFFGIDPGEADTTVEEIGVINEQVT